MNRCGILQGLGPTDLPLARQLHACRHQQAICRCRWLLLIGCSTERPPLQLRPPGLLPPLCRPHGGCCSQGRGGSNHG